MVSNSSGHEMTKNKKLDVVQPTNIMIKGAKKRGRQPASFSFRSEENFLSFLVLGTAAAAVLIFQLSPNTAQLSTPCKQVDKKASHAPISLLGPSCARYNSANHRRERLPMNSTPTE